MRQAHIAFERRASVVLYFYLRSIERSGVWLLPANVCPVVPAVFLKAERTFDFVDVEKDTLCIDRNAVIALLQKSPKRYAGILFVRTYGHPGDFDPFFSAVKKLANFRIIDDACLSRPHFEHSGGNADLELNSTGYSKYVDLGWGGWGMFRDQPDYLRINQPFDPSAHEALVSQFHDSLSKKRTFSYTDIPWLDCGDPHMTWDEYQQIVESKATEAAAHKAIINEVYDQFLSKWKLPSGIAEWRYTILCKHPPKVLEAIFAAGHFASSHYASLAPMFGEGSTPLADLYGKQVVNLFNDFRYTEARALELARLVNTFLSNPIN